MRNYLKISFIAICILMLINVQAQKKVTYGKSTFIVYQPLPGLAPLPVCGFVPDVPGYTLKDKNYGAGTYYAYAPGTVIKTNYKCILTEIRDWIAYRPDKVKEIAAKKGMKPLDEKTAKKMFKDSRIPYGSLVYQLSDTSWIGFVIGELQNCGPKAWESHEPYVVTVSYIEKVPQQTDIVLDRIYRFWNDGVKFSDYAAVHQSNFETRPTAPTDQNPNNFSIGDVLNPKKGFYRLSFKEVKPTYVWHSYKKVVTENLEKSNFDVTGELGFYDLLSAFDYELNAGKSGKNLYFCYSVSSRFLRDLLPGVTWIKEMSDRKKNDAAARAEIKKTQKANEKQLELMYKEIFK